MPQRATDAVGDATTYTYDSVGRKLTMVDPDGNAPGGSPAAHTWSYSYDNEDRVTQTSAPAPQAGGSPLITQQRYDPLGNRTVVIDANGQVTKYLYDVRDGLAEVDQSPSPWTDPNTTPSPLYRTTYSYDNLGDLSRMTRAAGDSQNERATDYQFDGLNRLRKELQYSSWPSTSGALATGTTYDANGNATQLAKPDGSMINYAYDALNRLTGRDSPSVTYTLDADGNRQTMVDPTGTTTYAYDELDRLTSVTSPGGVAVGYRLDLDGNRRKLIYPDGTAVTYTLDKIPTLRVGTHRLQSMQDWAGRATSYGSFPDGNVQAVTNVNGTTATSTEDNAQRLTQVWNKASGGATISQHTYTLDNVGNRTQLQETVARVGGGSSSYTLPYGLDRLYELTSAGQPGGGTNTYSYDPVGNRLTSSTGPDMTYDKADRITTLLYQTDADRNLTTIPSGHLSYDSANRLTGASLGSGRDAYALDGDGTRAQTATTSGLTTTITYAYDVARPLPAMLQTTEQGFGGTTTHKYVWGLGLAYSVDNTGAVAVDHPDGLGAVRALTDGTGTVIQAYQTNEFSVTIQNQGNSTQRLQYAGEERDATGFVHLRAAGRAASSCGIVKASVSRPSRRLRGVRQ